MLHGPGGSPGHEWGAWRGLLALSTSNVWIVHVDSPCGQPTWTSAGDHHLRWLNLQEKVGRGTLDLELSLDSYSGAPRGPRASPGPHLGLQRNVTNLLAQGSRAPAPRRRARQLATCVVGQYGRFGLWTITSACVESQQSEATELTGRPAVSAKTRRVGGSHFAASRVAMSRGNALCHTLQAAPGEFDTRSVPATGDCFFDASTCSCLLRAERTSC